MARALQGALAYSGFTFRFLEYFAMKAIPAALTLALLTACASSNHKIASSLPGNLHYLSSSSPLACVFEKMVIEAGKESKSTWNFWRWPNRIETRDEMSQQGEIWQKDAGGRIFYTRLFYPERVALEYMPGDLAATGVEPHWEQLEAGLLDPRQLGARLRLLGKEYGSGLNLERYAGTLDGIATEVDWLPSLRLPSRITKRFPERLVILAMRDCRELSKTQTQPLSSQELDSYRHIDFSDLGDMESDPKVQRIMELTGSHHHEH